MCTVFGYARISTAKQSIERQIRNILSFNPEAVIYREAFTGTKVQGRDEWAKLMKRIKAGDTIIFDSVSRMSRNAAEGTALYRKLYEGGINLIFIKERHIDTETYRQAARSQISEIDTGDQAANDLLNTITEALNRYTLALAERQIELAFAQAEKEVNDLHQRTREGIETARMQGKQIGQRKDAKLNVKKSKPAKEIILKHSKTFGGTLTDIECIKQTGLSRNTYYKYKRELLEESETQGKSI